MNNSDTLYVVAPSYQRFVSWCQDRGVSPRDRKYARYIRDIRDVQGIQLESKNQIVDLYEIDELTSRSYDLVMALMTRVKD